MKMKIRQLWHVLFGHPWEFCKALSTMQMYNLLYDIERNADISIENHYSQCKCGLMRRGWSAFTS